MPLPLSPSYIETTADDPCLTRPSPWYVLALTTTRREESPTSMSPASFRKQQQLMALARWMDFLSTLSRSNTCFGQVKLLLVEPQRSKGKQLGERGINGWGPSAGG